MKKIFLLFILLITVSVLNANNLRNRIDRVFKLYDKNMFNESLVLIDSVLIDKAEDYETLSGKASANWCLSWIYKNPANVNKDVNKSYQFAERTLNLYNQIKNKYPNYDTNSVTYSINDITKEMNQLIIDFPGCDKVKAENTQIINVNTDKTVTITVSGSGKTQDEAKQSALRSAIEQAFGVFISAKTEILNDQLISDQITSISNGNIQSFNILNSSQLPDGSWGVTLKALVSISKLTSFVEAKGVTVEMKGGLFALNIKQQILNEQAEYKAVYDMIGLLHEPMQTAFDYTIKSGEPVSVDSDSKNWQIPLTVTATTNKNMDFCSDYFINTLQSICLTSSEQQNYINLKKPISEFN